MKHIALISFVFCILFMTGCRTVRSVQTSDERRMQKMEHAVYVSLLDSISQSLVLSVDSVCIEFEQIHNTDSTRKTIRHPRKVKAYRVCTKAATEAKTTAQVVLNDTETKQRQTSMAKHSLNHRAGPTGVAQWIWIGAVFLLLLALVNKLHRQ